MLTPSHRLGVAAPRLAATCSRADGRWTVVAERATDPPPLGRPLVQGEDLLAACAALMAPDDRNELASLAREVAERGAGEGLLRLVVGGEARPVRLTAVCTPDGDDRVSVVLADVTDRPDAAPAPSRRTPDLARALERIGVVAFDTRFSEDSVEAIYASPGLRDLLGRDFDLRDAHEVYFESIHPDDRSRVLRRAEAVRTGSARPPIEHRIVRPDGAIRWIKVADHPTMETGGTTRVSGTILDVTQAHDAAALQALAAEAFDTHAVVVVLRGDGTLTAEGPAVAEWARIAGDPAEPGCAAALLVREAVDADGRVERACPARDGSGARMVAARRMGRTREGHRVAVAIRRAADGGDWAVWRQVLDLLDEAVMISVMEPDGRRRIEYANPGVSSALGRALPEDPYEGFEAVRNAVHPADRPAVAAASQRLAGGEGDGEVSYRVVQPDGHSRWVRHRAVVLGSGPDGTRLVTVGTDVALERGHEERVRALLSGAGGVVYEHVRSPQGETRLVMAERDAVGLLQRSVPSDPRSLPDIWLAAVHEDDRLRYSQWDTGGGTGEDIAIEYRLVRPNGSLVWMRDTRVPTGEGRSLGVVTDVTREKVATLRSDLSLDGLPGIMFDAELLPSGAWRVFGVGGQSPRTLGMSFTDDPDDAGRRMADAVHPDDRAMVAERVREVAVTGAPLQLAYRVVRSGGQVRWMRLVLNRREFARDRVMLSGMVTDVTSLRHAEERVARMIDAFHEAFFEFDLPADGEMRLEYSSIAMERMLGRPLPEDPVGRARALLSAIHPEDRSPLLMRIHDAASRSATAPIAFRVVRPDGEVRWVSGQIAPSGGPAQERRFAGVLSDVTDRHRTEQRFSRILDAVDDVALEFEVGTGDVTRLIYVSRGLGRILGADLPDDAAEVQAVLRDLLDPRDASLLDADVRSVAERGGSASRLVRLRRPDGEPRSVRMTLARTGRVGARVLVGGIARDITDIRRDRDPVRSALESVSDVVRELRLEPDGSWRLLYLSAEAERLTGRALPRDPEGRLSLYAGCVHPDDAPGLDARCRAVVAHGEVVSAVYRVLRPDGEVRWVRSTLTPLLDGAGERAGVTEIATDVSDVLGAPSRPPGDAAVLEDVVASIGEAVYEIRISPGRPATTTYVSSPFWDLLGIPATADEEPLTLWHRAVHPDDADRAQAHCDAVARGVPQLTELRVVRPDGGVRWVRHAARPRTAEDGAVVVAGTLSDVTEAHAQAAPAGAPGGASGAPEPAADCPLTDRQLAVLRLIAQGAGTDEVADRLGIRAVTVNNHVAGALRRLDARSRLEAVAKARRAGYIA